MQRWSTFFTLLVLLHSLAAFASGQARVTTVGIIGFRDESGAKASGEILQTIAGGLQQHLNRVYKDTLLARALSADGDRTVAQLGALGKQDGVAFVVRGGVLALSANTVQLYVDLISVENGSVTTLRAEGESSDVDGALSAAIQELSVSIHDLVGSTAAARVSAAPRPEDSPDVPSSDVPVADLAAAETEEELWQLVAQAEAILGSPSAISTQTLTALRLALEGLNRSLETKATVVAQGGDSSQADREIATRKQELQSALTAATDEAAAAQEAPASFQEPSAEKAEKKGILASIGDYVGEATNILQQIQEFRATWNAARED